MDKTFPYTISNLEQGLDDFFSEVLIQNPHLSNNVQKLKIRYTDSSRKYDNDIYVSSSQFIEIKKSSPFVEPISATTKVHPMTTALKLY